MYHLDRYSSLPVRTSSEQVNFKCPQETDVLRNQKFRMLPSGSRRANPGRSSRHYKSGTALSSHGRGNEIQLLSGNYSKGMFCQGGVIRQASPLPA